MNSKEKIKNIKSVINEFYHTEKCEGRLTECANDCWKSYQKDCDEIKQDLDRLEKLEKALEILINKKVYIYGIKTSSSVKQYNNIIIGTDFNKLTKEQYEILKEVLEYDK